MSGKDKDKQEKQSTTERLVKGESHNKTPVASRRSFSCQSAGGVGGGGGGV